MKFDGGAFEGWLLEQGYREQTADSYRRIVARTLDVERPLCRQYEFAAMGRYADFLEATGKTAEAVRERATPPKVTRVARRREAQSRTKARSTSIPDHEWQALAEALASTPSPEARCLEVMLATGLRVGDLLAVRRDALVSASKSGKLRLETKGGEQRILPMGEEWRALLAAWKAGEKAVGVTEDGWWPTVGAWLCRRPGLVDGADAAGYKRLQRALKAAAEEAEIDDRVHLHRLRRTVAVQALRTTRDTATVMQMLGHRNIQTTAGYLDEARPDDIAELGEKLRTFRKGPKT